MTVLDEAPVSTATGPTARTVARGWRGPLLVVAGVVLTAVLTALVYSAPKGALDPQSYDPQGAHAIAVLLQHRGVTVEHLETVDAVAPRGDSTVFVPIAAALTPSEVRRLSTFPGRLVLVGAYGPQLTALGDLEEGPDVPVERRQPACSLPIARRAGEVDIGGVSYRTSNAQTGCYASGGRATLVDLADRRTTLVGSADLFTNDRLDKRGNAALAVGLLGAGTDVQWLLPRPGVRGATSGKHLNDLVPTAVKLAVLQLFIAVAVLALWRARRLGAVVTEPLPVVVRAAEAVEGRSRLYRASRSRGTAAEALRAGARDGLARRLGLGPEGTKEGLVSAVVARTGGDPVVVDALLYGAAPTDDEALVALADALDLLILEVAGS